ncbi:ComF family protein [Halalkalibacter krulwichiae]|uniref:DNA utilization protein GntX n=1 Tax=Halalkalibacter krulwichiae TaxID=199441 RepID=A0A1X9MM32_9BACI|nr:phosphoribosyltransferase family protein [Halalkalibacter krulwichiae]ARK32102.1 DNA utilization protein GntX [Halalkalibacter krulwichiae]
MRRCLSCHEHFIEPVSWRTLFLLEQAALLCQLCEAELVPLRDLRCIRCSRSLQTLPQNYIKESQCLDCWRWEQRADTTGLLTRNCSLYEYNAFLKEWLAVYKYRGDAEIARFFSPLMHKLYRTEFAGYLPVAIPLSDERLYARGFNQAELLIKEWSETSDVLKRKTSEKQSKKNRDQRITDFQKQTFQINEENVSRIHQKKIVLIDDVYTTGTTIRQACKMLLAHGAKEVASMTIAR